MRTVNYTPPTYKQRLARMSPAEREAWRERDRARSRAAHAKRNEGREIRSGFGERITDKEVAVRLAWLHEFDRRRALASTILCDMSRSVADRKQARIALAELDYRAGVLLRAMVTT